MLNTTLCRVLALAGLCLLAVLPPAAAADNFQTPAAASPPDKDKKDTRGAPELMPENKTAPPVTAKTLPAPAALQPTVYDWLKGSPNSVSYYDALQQAGLLDRLSGPTKYTVLVPTNEAFAKLPAGVLDALFLPENHDLLVQVIDYNTIPGSVTADGLLSKQTVSMVRGGEARVVKVNGRVRIADAYIIASDESSGNGVVHLVDTVLLPPAVIQALATEGYRFTAYYDNPDDEQGVVIDSTQRNYGSDNAERGYIYSHDKTYYIDPGYTDTYGVYHYRTPFGDSGTYGNSNNYVNRANFYNSALAGYPDGTLYSPSMRTVRAPAGGYYMAAGQYTADTPPMWDAQAELEHSMRKLWTDHVVWTRNYIIAAVDNKPGAEQATDRLMQNQEDIGATIGTYYGPEAGDKLTALLKEHIGIAVKLIEAARNKDNAEFAAQNTQWENNGQAIARFLSEANPNWPLATTSEMMQEHLATTTAEVQARLDRDYAADVAAYDAVYDHILMMADALAEGIYKQYPQRVIAAYADSDGNGVVMGSYQTNPDYAWNNTYYSNDWEHRSRSHDSHRNNCCCR